MINYPCTLSTHQKNLIDKLNTVFSDVNLSKEEEGTLLWLSESDISTIDNIVSAIGKVKKNALQSTPRSFQQLSSEEQIQYWEQCEKEHESEGERW